MGRKKDYKLLAGQPGHTEQRYYSQLSLLNDSQLRQELRAIREMGHMTTNTENLRFYVRCETQVTHEMYSRKLLDSSLPINPDKLKK